ncbi:O-antigen ligase family protein [Porticoccaceae bacterium]|nr:O-antigen ligase family protein [Porticoccaceae bacterium]
MTSSILPPELMFIFHVLISIFLIFKNNLKFDKALFNLLIPIFCIAICGFAYASQNMTMNVLKDGWYLIKIIPCIIIGWISAKNMTKRDIFLSIIFAGTCLSFYHVVAFALYSAQGYGSDIIRIMVGSSPLSVLLLGILFSNRYFRRELEIFGFSSVFILVVNLWSIYLSDSRSSYLVMLIFVLVMNGFYKINFKGIMGLVIVIGFLSIVTTFLSIEEDPSGGRESLDSRFARGLLEITPSEGEDRKSRSLSFRGYESFLAMKEFSDGSLGEMILGQGFGATVDLGETWILGGVPGEEAGEVEFDELLIIHNGYLLVLVKYGMIGVLLYMYFIFSWIKLSHHRRTLVYGDEMFHRLIVATALASFMYSLVVTGLFNKTSFGALLIIVGALLCTCHKRNASLVSKEERLSELVSRQVKNQQGA